MNEIRQKFEAWLLTEAIDDGEIEWDAWRAAYEAGEIAMKEKAATRAADFYLAKGDALDIARAIRELRAAPEEKKP